jgi:transposase
MYIQRSKRPKKGGGYYESTLLCRKYREDGKIKTEVLLNLSILPSEAVLSLENSLKKNKNKITTILDTDISVERVVDFGFFFILFTLLNNLKISKLFDTVLPKQSAIIKLLIIGKIMTRGSKLEIFNWIKRNPFFAEVLGIELYKLESKNIYEVVSLLPTYQNKIERKWGLYNNANQSDIFLYDITSTYFEGQKNELSAFGYNRDNKSGKKQINIGLITNKDGFPLKIEVFNGNINDHLTVIEQLKSLKKDFNAKRIIFVGDRGMKIRYNLDKMNEIERSDIDYITGLTKEEIKSLINSDVIQLDLFSKDLVEVSEDSTRYVLSLNSELKNQKNDFRTQRREKFENEINKIQKSWQTRKNQNITNLERLKDNSKKTKYVTEFKEELIENYKKRVYKLLEKYNMNLYYKIIINSEEFTLNFDKKLYDNDKKLDGLYVLATSVKSTEMNTTEVREHYKKLQEVEHAFRDMKSGRLNIRPVFHVKESPTRGHVLISMFSYSIIYSIEQAIFPLLKTIKKESKKQLSYKDIESELNAIKIVEFNIGKNVQKIQITKLNEIQEKILDSLQIKSSDFDKFVDKNFKKK